MAIQFNANALNRFSNVDFGNDNAIANLGKGDGLVQKDELGSIFLRPFRAPSTRDRNNAVRTELLKALGRAFNLTGFNEDDGTFTDQFMRRLEELLGPEAFKRGDFGIKNGEVKSGKPLTQRRITAIVNAACEKGKEAVSGPKREEPIYIALDHSKEDKQKFMSFYNAKLDGFEKNGGPSKEEFDNVLSTLFNKVRGTSRTALVELLANGKIAILDENGLLPEGDELKKLDEDVKAMLKSLKSLSRNENIYNIVLNTVKTTDGALAPGDVDISSDELEDLRDAASEVDLSGLLSAEGDAETIGQKLAEFKQKVYAEFDGKCPDAKTKFSATKLAIMKNLFMHYAIMRTDIKVASFNGIASALRRNYSDMVKDRDTRELLDLIVPSIESAGYCKIVNAGDDDE